MQRLGSRSVFFAMVVLAFVIPNVAILLIVLAVVAQGVLGIFNISAGRRAQSLKSVSRATKSDSEIYFSVHVATHDEPPALVMRTLHALAAQIGSPAFEVIVMDNNTSDPALWHPVEALCAKLGPGFRFFHEDGVKGAKAGALNIALQRSDPRASHIVVVDADYEVSHDFLAVAAEEIRRSGDEFLQFPQAYRNDVDQAAGISLELADYFLRHARRADGADAMLLTGTLSVIRRDALEQVGGWSGQTITEDAELGLRLRRFGFRGRFIDRVVGRGILPLDLAGLALQRYRWAAGNMTTIMGGLSGIPPRVGLHIFAQLTAWANLALPFTGALIGGAVALLIGVNPQPAALLTSLSGLGLALVYLSVGLPLIIAAVVRGHLRQVVVLQALAARIALILPSAVGTMDALIGRSGSFQRTVKEADKATDDIGAVLPALTFTGFVLLVAVPGLPPMGALGALCLILPYPLARGTRTRLSAYRASLQSA